MTAKCAFGLGLLGFVVLAPAGFTQMAVGVDHPVTIKDNNCNTSDPNLKISIQDTVSWTAVDQKYILGFPTSPFTGVPTANPFPVPTGPAKSSGPVKDAVKNECKDNDPVNPANPHCNFKYSVKGTGPHACKQEDPVIIVTK